jgi:hypothetical protein
MRIFLYGEMLPQGECPVCVARAMAVACLGYRDYYAELAESLIRRGFVDRFSMNIEDFRGDLRRAVLTPIPSRGSRGTALRRLATRSKPSPHGITTLKHIKKIRSVRRPGARLMKGALRRMAGRPTSLIPARLTSTNSATSGATTPALAAAGRNTRSAVSA